MFSGGPKELAGLSLGNRFAKWYTAALPIGVFQMDVSLKGQRKRSRHVSFCETAVTAVKVQQRNTNTNTLRSINEVLRGVEVGFDLLKYPIQITKGIYRAVAESIKKVLLLLPPRSS